MNVGIFTDMPFGSTNGIMTALTAALRGTPPGLRLRIYTASALSVVDPEYLALPSLVLPVPFRGDRRMYLPRLMTYLAQAVTDQLDLVHMATPGPIGLAGLCVAARLGLPLVGSADPGLDAYTPAHRSSRLGMLMNRAVRLPYRRCARVLVPSDRARRLLVESGEDPQRVVVWRRGVDTQLFSPSKRSAALRERWHVCDRRPAVLYVGRVSGEKGAGLLPAICDRLHAVGVEHRLIVAGDGPLLACLREAVPDGLFTGMLPHARLAEVMASADLLVFPGCTDTAGTVMLEAQASGVPVVVAGAGGARENLISARTGAICYTRDPDEWASAMAAILRTGCLGAMRAQARQYAVTRRWETALDPLFRAYADVRTAHETARAAAVPLPAGPVDEGNLSR